VRGSSVCRVTEALLIAWERQATAEGLPRDGEFWPTGYRRIAEVRVSIAEVRFQ